MAGEKKWTVLGQDPDVLLAMWANVLSWLISTFAPSFLPRLLPNCDHEDTSYTESSSNGRTRCISIGRPGGLEQLRLITLKPGIVTMGYNLNQPPPFSKAIVMDQDIPKDCVVLHNEAFSVNYADCAIRWGLYESAKKFVGWPIVPGFDVAGTIEQVPPSAGDADESSEWKVGDKVFGCTLFGAYSSRVLIPKIQLRKIPAGISMAEAASIPAAALTALYAFLLAGHFPQSSIYRNKSVLIHSAAGGVGSMMVQIAKILRLSPIVGVVGSTSKVDAAKALGCDIVIDKSQEDLWKAAHAAAPNGYFTIMDANGVSTLSDSYNHLAPTGRLIVFGFHSNLPLGRAALSPMQWIGMARKMSNMPKFDPMDLTVSNKSVLGFNLSFFAEEKEIVKVLFDQICDWLEDGTLRCSRVVEMDFHEIGDAHNLIMSGKSVGKIVIHAR